MLRPAENGAGQEEEPKYIFIVYKDSSHAVADIRLEGGRGEDEVLIEKIFKTDGPAANAGLKPGDALYQVGNGGAGKYFEERSPDEILPAIRGPVILCFESRTPDKQDPFAKTRMMPKVRESDPSFDRQRMYVCICGITNFRAQKNCRLCGKQQPGWVPPLEDEYNPNRYRQQFKSFDRHNLKADAPIIWAPVPLTDADVHHAFREGSKLEPEVRKIRAKEHREQFRKEQAMMKDGGKNGKNWRKNADKAKPL